MPHFFTQIQVRFNLVDLLFAMVKHSITVFARLRNTSYEQKVDYIVNQLENSDEINLRCQKQEYAAFRFKQIFDCLSSQTDIFDHVAKPVVKRVLEGVNGTIFAYGQTGSGKTYSISGCSQNYTHRGIIPRTLEYIYEYVKLFEDDFHVCISYLEIYNEHVYDLLKKRTDLIPRERLQRVMKSEGIMGGTQLKNLNTIPVKNVREALKLLMVGEGNRATAETYLNDRSSRSHCIFTIYLKTTDPTTRHIKFSKLNIIDLAGSERVYKSHLNGTLLKEAQHINLSLHYLEHVILSLSENKKHVPYRNCIMTYLLKDSLTGNCLTVMLATLSTDRIFNQETISTCKFAQRVAQLDTDVNANIHLDPEYQVKCLKNKIQDLEQELVRLSSLKSKGDISINKQNDILNKLNQYLMDKADELEVEPDITVIQFCFKKMKSRIRSLEEEKEKLWMGGDGKKSRANSLTSLDYVPQKEIACPSMAEERRQLFREFIDQTVEQKTIEKYTNALNNKLDMSKVCKDTIEQCQLNIDCIQEKLQIVKGEKEKQQLLHHLEDQQILYTETDSLLHQIKRDTNNLEKLLQEGKLELVQKFKMWLIEVKNLPDVSKEDFEIDQENFLNAYQI